MQASKSLALQVALIALVVSVVTTLLVEHLRDSPKARAVPAAAPPLGPSPGPSNGPPIGSPRDEAPARLAPPGSVQPADDAALSELRERVATLEQRLARESDTSRRRRPVQAELLPADREELRDFVLEVMTTNQEEQTDAELVAAREEHRNSIASGIRMEDRENEEVDLLDYEVEALVDIVVDIEQRRAKLQASVGPQTEASELEALERDYNALEGELRRRIEQLIGVQRTNALFGEE